MHSTIKPATAVARYVAGLLLSSLAVGPLLYIFTLLISLLPGRTLSTHSSLDATRFIELWEILIVILPVLAMPVIFVLRAIVGTKSKWPYIVSAALVGLALGIIWRHPPCAKPPVTPQSSAWNDAVLADYDRCMQQLPTSAAALVLENIFLFTALTGAICGFIFWLVSGVRYDWQVTVVKDRTYNLSFIWYALLSCSIVAFMPFVCFFLFIRMTDECGAWPILVPPFPDLVLGYVCGMGTAVTLTVFASAHRVYGKSMRTSAAIGLLYGVATASLFVTLYLSNFQQTGQVAELMRSNYGEPQIFIRLGIALTVASVLILLAGRRSFFKSLPRQ